MRFRHYDNLRVFSIVARHGSLSAAAEELNLTKGAVSYQIRGLEAELGFEVFRRLPRGISLTARGQSLRDTIQTAFETVEQKISDLREINDRSVTLAVSTYFASRWLSSRLMDFMKRHPKIRLRIQPMVDLIDLTGENIDLAIRWGDGGWTDMAIEPMFSCPAFATGASGSNALVEELGLEQVLSQMTLLKDREGSPSWQDWHSEAGLPYRKKADTLVIPDPNVRVQAVIDGQGLALNDALVDPELQSGRLDRLSQVQLDSYGYFLAYRPGTRSNPDIDAFAQWLLDQAAGGG